eukprot:6178115-Pleurochrysis_carterae.AAC.1
MAKTSQLHWKRVFGGRFGRARRNRGRQTALRRPMPRAEGASRREQRTVGQRRASRHQMPRRSTSSSSNFEFSFSRREQSRLEEDDEPVLRPAGENLDQENMSFKPSAFNGMQGDDPTKSRNALLSLHQV